MTSSKANEGVVEIYLISENENFEGELLVKAINSSGLEIARSKVMMALQKDDAKLFSFNFDKSLDLDLVTKYLVDLRRSKHSKYFNNFETCLHRQILLLYIFRWKDGRVVECMVLKTAEPVTVPGFESSPSAISQQ